MSKAGDSSSILTAARWPSRNATCRHDSLCCVCKIRKTSYKKSMALTVNLQPNLITLLLRGSVKVPSQIYILDILQQLTKGFKVASWTTEVIMTCSQLSATNLWCSMFSLILIWYITRTQTGMFEAITTSIVLWLHHKEQAVPHALFLGKRKASILEWLRLSTIQRP